MSLTPDEIEAERKRFEAWWYGLYGAKCLELNAYFQRLGNGYLSWRIEGQWKTWLAAIESERERVRKEQDDAESVTEKLGRFWPSGERGE